MSLPPSTRRSLLSLLAASTLAAGACAVDTSPDTTAEPVGQNHTVSEDWNGRRPRDPADGEASPQDHDARGDQPGALIVNKRDDGAVDRWSPQQAMNLTYCVSALFDDDHDEVVRAMESAGADWAQAAAVRFVHRVREDRACDADNDRVVFEVVPAQGTRYTAKSFFPSLAARGNHELFIDLDNVARGAPKTLTGILRHELGHVLGFRHEHARPESNGVCAEGPDWRALTPYDPDSVMHYNAESPCAGANEGDYVLSPLDKAGAARLYGPPRDAS